MEHSVTPRRNTVQTWRKLVAVCLLAAWALPAMTRPLQPWSEPEWQAGVALSPSAGLLRWLDGQSGRLLRLPVDLERQADGLVLRAHLGELPIRLDDGALGISLIDRLRGRCASRCRLWLVGYWRGAGVFELRHVGDPTTADQAGMAAEQEGVR